jgi:hypothetical protein
MSKRIEKGFIDRLLNGKLLGKRKLGLPVKYNFDLPAYESLFIDKLYFPKNNFDKLIGNVFERCLPGIQYFIWNDQIRWAREHGYTIAEKFFTTFRHSNTITLHALAQMVHPYGYLDMQKKDQFIRKVASLLPGIEAPDWAQQSKRVPDCDYNSLTVPYEATRHIERETTPAPHYNAATYTVINNLFDQRWNVGYSAQRLFYNEDLRGDFYRTGLLSKQEKEQIHGWYNDAQRHSQKDKITSMTDDERVQYEKNVERWDNNFKEFFPEVHNSLKSNHITHKYDEPYYERNMNDIRGSIFTSKWISALEKQTFNDEEINRIHDFFLNNNSHSFFEKIGETIEGNSTYHKFIAELNFPDILKIDRFTVYPPEKQFIDIMDENWGICFDTVDTFRRLYLQMIKNQNSNSNINSLVLEEVYNPLFRLILSKEYKYDVKQTESISLRAIQNGVSVESLEKLCERAKNESLLTSTAVLKQVVDTQIRDIVKQFN